MSDALMAMPTSKGNDPLKTAVDRKAQLQDQLRTDSALRDLNTKGNAVSTPRPQVWGANG